MRERKRFPTKGIYKAKISRGYYLTDEDQKRYCYITPAKGAQPANWIADCWIVNINGLHNPGTNISPVPIHREDIGRRVK